MGDEQMKLVAELLEIREIEEKEERVDAYGFRWRKYKRILRVIGRREFNIIKEDIPEEIKGIVIEKEVWCCADPGYSWHFAIRLGNRPLLITLSEEESKEILEKRIFRG